MGLLFVFTRSMGRGGAGTMTATEAMAASTALVVAAFIDGFEVRGGLGGS